MLANQTIELLEEEEVTRSTLLGIEESEGTSVNAVGKDVDGSGERRR